MLLVHQDCCLNVGLLFYESIWFFFIYFKTKWNTPNLTPMQYQTPFLKAEIYSTSYFVNTFPHSPKTTVNSENITGFFIYLIYIGRYDMQATALTLQQFTDRLNNHSRSWELLYDVADLQLETVTRFFPRTMLDGLSWKF